MVLGAARAGLLGAAGGGATIPAAGGYSLSFNGSTAYGQTAAGPFGGLSACSVAFQFKIAVPHTTGSFFGMYDSRDNNRFYGQYLNQGTNDAVHALMWHGGSFERRQYNPGHSLDDSVWRHCVMTFDRTLGAGTQIKLYINGVEGGTNVATLDVGGNFASSVAFIVGAVYFSSAYRSWFQGFITDLMGFSSALTPTEVSDLYADRADPGTLIYQWPCSEGSGTSVEDTVGGYDFTLTNVTWSSDVP